MKRYIISGSLILIMSMACEEKKKTVRKPVQPMPVTSEVTSSPEINLPSIVTPPSEDPIEAPKDKITSVDKTPSPVIKPSEPEPISLAAKTLPIPTVKYEDVSSRDLAEGSANEMKDEGLARIREKAVQRAKELEEEQSTAPVDADAAVTAEGAKLAMTEPSEPASAVTEPVAEVSSEQSAELPLEEPVTINQSIDKKTKKKLDIRFTAAVAKAKAGKVEMAKNEFLSICQSGHAHACHKFAWYEEQSGNQLNATRFYRAACDNGLGKSCNNLAFQFEQKKNFDKALELYAKGCMDKHEASCQSLKRIREEQKSEELKTR
ncbi:MAG: hypothetical protein EOP10_13835 [Proteobacteria bacterium]|nr:MAG: hypothetical protein EOP10_13835 [Pseudomonadota bacterium]